MTDPAACWCGLQVKDLILTSLTCKYDVIVYLCLHCEGGEQFFLTIQLLQSCEGDLLCESSEQPRGSLGSSTASAGLDTKRAQIFICFCMCCAAKCGFEGTLLVLRRVLDAEGNFWLLLTCCEISDIRLRTNIIEHQ